MGTRLSFRFGGSSSPLPGPCGYVSMSWYHRGKDRKSLGVGGCQVALNQDPLRGLVIIGMVAEWCIYFGVQETWV